MFDKPTKSSLVMPVAVDINYELYEENEYDKKYRINNIEIGNIGLLCSKSLTLVKRFGSRI